MTTPPADTARRPTQGATATGPTRDQSLDLARGWAMLLVVFGHVLRGVFTAGLVPAELAGGLRAVDRVVYLTHLPVFAWVSGLLMTRPVRQRGARAYLLPRLADFAYLYLLWTLLQGGLEVATSSVKNNPVTWLDVVNIFVPIGHLWFLPTLALGTVLGVSALSGRPRLVAGVSIVVGLAAWGHEDQIMFAGGALLPFFVLGALCGYERWARVAGRLLDRPAVAVAVLVAAAGLIVVLSPWALPPTSTGPAYGPTSVLLGVLCSVLAVLVVLLLAGAIARRWQLDWFARLGRDSLPIYLAHIAFAAGVRVVLLRLGVTDVWLHLVAGTAAGIGGPLLLTTLLGKPLWWLFRRPRWGSAQ
ncbi:acyltransferase family protein [Granulicoccus phenolivorans]|uniref:acyltransferase family protein n=1 Tax=Granulicoccus phenolivorans TaxID=266854 RepID=UPI0004226405|nr:acyltransferase [Granulicoccus phenolivorans]